jgi:hypothetical protein
MRKDGDVMMLKGTFIQFLVANTSGQKGLELSTEIKCHV